MTDTHDTCAYCGAEPTTEGTVQHHSGSGSRVDLCDNCWGQLEDRCARCGKPTGDGADIWSFDSGRVYRVCNGCGNGAVYR